MAGLKIDRQKCSACGACTAACAVGALALVKGRLEVSEDCQQCGLCVDSCPQEALTMAQDQAASAAGQGVWFFAETEQGRLLGVARELAGVCRRLADRLGTQVTALLGQTASPDTLAAELIACGADVVRVCCDARLAVKLEEGYCDWLAAEVRQQQPEILLLGATGFGRSLAPRLAARLRTGLTADCTQLEIDGPSGLLAQTRPAFGGNLLATIVTAQRRPQMATVRPKVFAEPPADQRRQGKVLRSAAVDFQPLSRLLSEQARQQRTIADARIVVAAGRGLGKKQNLCYVEELAALLGGEMACSRPLVDLGWCPQERQVGQTGRTIAPKLYLACGISGAIQHVVGIAGAETVVAINNDPQAPIFARADYQVVGDVLAVLQALIARLQRRDG